MNAELPTTGTIPESEVLFAGIIDSALDAVITIGGEDGKPARMFGTVQDVTEQKGVEARLIELNRQLETERSRLAGIIASVPGIVWESSWDESEEQRVNFVSDYVQTMLGYTVEEWCSTRNFWQTILHKDDRERVAKESAEHIAGGANEFAQEYRWIAKDGRELWAQTNMSVMRGNPDGEPIGIRGVTIETTDRKVAEQLIRDSESRYRMLFDSNPLPMWVFDLDTLGFLEVNDAAIRHYGFSREEFMSMTIKDIRPIEAITALEQDLAHLDSPFGKTATWAHKKKNGDLISVEITANSFDFNGRRARLVLANDVTVRQSLEDQLRQSQKMEAVGMLAGGIAHDFNNLLTAINGYSELLKRKIDADDPRYSHAEEISRAGERAARLTAQLLAFSKKQVLQPRLIDLNVSVSEMEKMLTRLIGETIDLQIELAKDLDRVLADPSQIEQIILNLAVNARDAMPDGGKLTIETSNVYLDDGYAEQQVSVQPGNFVMLCVSDSGAGMTTDVMEHIFEPFFSTKETGKGTGLGLSTTYGIVDQSGGHIRVHSEPGNGATFRIYFPKAPDKSEPTEDTKAPESLLGTETILIAEDEDAVRSLSQQVLELYGYTVLAAANGNEAIDIAASYPGKIDVLITDMIMPGIGGRELAGRLELMHPDIRVIFMSGYPDADGTVNSLHKPFSTDALAQKVREVLDLK
ncbi:MAG: PAS domain S-box protein [Pyrinomonadaceae bacterium]